MMKHYTAENILNLIDNFGDESERAAVLNHINSVCPACQRKMSLLTTAISGIAVTTLKKQYLRQIREENAAEKFIKKIEPMDLSQAVSLINAMKANLTPSLLISLLKRTSTSISSKPEDPEKWINISATVKKLLRKTKDNGFTLMDYEYAVASFFKTRGFYHQMKSEFRIAENDYLKAEEIYKKMNDDLEVANVFLGKAEVLKARGKGNEAVEGLAKALTIFKSFKAETHMAHCLLGLAAALTDTEDFDLADETLNQFFSLSITKNSNLLKAHGLHSLGILRHREGRFPFAEDAYLSAFALYQAVGARHESARVYKNIGHLFEDRMENEKAIDYYLRAARGFERLSISADSALCLFYATNLYLHQDRLYEAEITFERALKNLQKTNRYHEEDRLEFVSKKLGCALTNRKSELSLKYLTLLINSLSQRYRKN